MTLTEGVPWPNHRFHGLALKGGYCRQVTVTVSGCHRVMPRALPRPDSLVLNLYRYCESNDRCWICLFHCLTSS